MLGIKIKNQWLSLDDDTAFEWEIENPLFVEGKLLGDISGDFSVPAMPNASVFDYAHIISHNTNGQPSYSGEVWCDGRRLFLVTVTIESCSNRRYNLSMVNKAVSDIAGLLLTDVAWDDEAAITPPTVNAGAYPAFSHCYPVVKNDLFFAFDQDPNFQALGYMFNVGNYTGYINMPYQSTAFLVPSAVVPMFYVYYILKSFFQKIGYSFSANWDSEMLSLFICNSYSVLDFMNVAGPPFDFFGLPATINPKNHLPQITIAKLLGDLEAKFGVKAYFNALAGTVVLRFAKDILQQVSFVDINSWHVTRDYVIDWTKNDIVNRCYEVDDLDGFCTEPVKVQSPNVLTATVATFWDLPAPSTVSSTLVYFVQNQNTYFQSKAVEDPPASGTYIRKWVVFSHRDYCLEVGASDNIESSTPALMESNDTPTITVDRWITPRIDQLGSERLYFDIGMLDSIDNYVHGFSLRLSFYRGILPTKNNIQPDYALANYAPFDAKNNIIGQYSLDYNDPDYGLHTQFLSRYYAMLQNTKVVERDLRLSVTDLLNLDLSKKVGLVELEGLQLYFIKKIKIRFSTKGIGIARAELCKTY